MLWLAVAAVPWMAVLCVIDIRVRRLPNWLTLPGAALIVTVASLAGYGAEAVTGGLGLAGVYLVTHVISPRGMGAGDVKLALGIGALTGTFGLGAWFLCAIGAPLLTVGAGAVAAALVHRASALSAARRIRLPHGPSMCAAAVVAIGFAVVAGE
ncbi:prepilin peptidase [Hoyosella altamirensis]|uniref:Leader peptidase (Prepilin peptidase)/N-methyltransferase n=1 Tax=Hoyosella altamirensis TaxID=616997 RepID=A0A839RV59_9ACTN|nr:A24 family peptidase [Hoyosella altamirensis]MBB3039934.1 leader peptidase (prepilin peptidase)/N-methyltransferase [Hoyosella altamirensis]